MNKLNQTTNLLSQSSNLNECLEIIFLMMKIFFLKHFSVFGTTMEMVTLHLLDNYMFTNSLAGPSISQS